VGCHQGYLEPNDEATLRSSASSLTLTASPLDDQIEGLVANRHDACGLTTRFLAFRVASFALKYSPPSKQAAKTGTTRGRAFGCTVASRYVSPSARRPRTSVHAVSGTLRGLEGRSATASFPLTKGPSMNSIEKHTQLPVTGVRAVADLLHAPSTSTKVGDSIRPFRLVPSGGTREKTIFRLGSRSEILDALAQAGFPVSRKERKGFRMRVWFESEPG
jgi:hypothetical protein